MSVSAGEVVLGRLRQVKYFLYSNYVPTLQILLEACQRNEVEPELMWRDDVIDSVIERCVAGSSFTGSGEEYYGKISENPTLRAQINGVYEHFHPRFKRGPANDGLIIESAAKYRVNFDTQSLVNMVIDNNTLVGSKPLFECLAKSEQFIEQQSELRQRQQWIAELTQNGTKPFTVDGKTYDTKGFEIQFSSSGGRARVKDDEGFPGWTDEQVKYACDVVMRTRRLKGMDVADLRKHAHQEGVKRFEDRFHVNPETNTPTKMSKQLIDPRSGQTFTTKGQLVSFINSFERSEGTKRLIVRNGKIDPELGAEFERLMNS